MLALTAAHMRLDFSGSPLEEPLSDEEHTYHAAQLAGAPQFPNYS
jgi:hypothetical protein